MKVLVDYELCEGHGECVVAAPDVFDMNEDGDKVVLLQESPHEELRPQVKDAVMMCPIAALQIED